MIRLCTMFVALLVGLGWASVAWAAAITKASDPSQIGDSRHLVMMIVYATVAIGFSFLCSVAEAVVLSVTPSYIANLENLGRPSAGALKKVKGDIDRSLAAILTLNTIAHTVGAGGAGAEAAAYFGDQYVGASMAVLTLLILFLSEIIPKTLGALYWRQLGPLAAKFVRALIILLYPLIFISDLLTTFLTRGKKVHPFSRDEFAALADVGEQSGDLDPKESRILKNLFRFPSLRASDIMTPRTVVFTLQQDQTVEQVLWEHEEVNFSRIPVYAADRDEITGFVLKSDMFLDIHKTGGKATLAELKRPLRAVTETTRLSNVLEELLDNRAHILLVFDDYGGMEGIVTLEDVVETLIGFEIIDEADRIDDMRRLARQKWEQRMKRLGIDVREDDDSPEEEE